MATVTEVKKVISDNIKTNNNNEITANVLAGVLNGMVDFSNNGTPEGFYSKTEIDNKFPITTNRRVLNPNNAGTNRYWTNFSNSLSTSLYQITVGYGNGLIQTNQYSTNLYVQSTDSFFNFSVAPLTPKVTLTSGNSSYIIGNGDTGWNRDLAFTVNNVAISAPGFNNTSLRELKENIKDYKDNALELINNLKIVRYDYKDENSPKNMIGVIVDDESTAEDFKSENKEGIDLYKMISILTKAVQELSKKIS